MSGLELDGVCSGYGPTRILHGVDLLLPLGAALAVLGRNGAGKTTLVGTIAGRVRLQSGAVRWRGGELGGSAPSARCRQGIGLVPQDRQVFRTLTVEENLLVADRGGVWTADLVYAMFPLLAARRRHSGGQLSGGEQQMLAIGRALMGSPELLLLDEPFEGLAPVIVDALLAALLRLRSERGTALLLVEQQARLALELADAAVVLERGRVRLAGTRDELRARWAEVEGLLSVSDRPAEGQPDRLAR